MSLLWLFLTALVTLITVAVLVAFGQRFVAGFTVVLVLEIAYSGAILAFVAAATVKTWSGTRPVTIRPRNAPGQVFIAVSVLSVGLYLALLLISLLPETPAERHARLGVAAERRRRGHAVPGT